MPREDADERPEVITYALSAGSFLVQWLTTGRTASRLSGSSWKTICDQLPTPPLGRTDDDIALLALRCHL